MASIDDIWDAPATPSSPKTPRHLDTDEYDVEIRRPSKRQKQTLFLSDSEDENGSGMRRGVVRAPAPVTDPGMDDDVEAMFADAENDEGLSFKKIGDLDVAAMEREAEARHRRATPLTPHPVMPSSSPARDGNNAGSGNGSSHNNKGKGKDEKKRARPVPLNENLLLGPTGFPDLISQVKDYKVKGKGREAEDLTRLMRVYNFWAHKLHPKLKFHDTVVRIEKLCHAKRMQVALSVWRDEAHGKTRELDADLSLDSDENGEGQNNTTSMNEGTRPPRNASPEAPTTPHSIPPGQDTDQDGFSLPPSSRASSQPPTSDFPDDGNLFGPPSYHSRLNGISTTSTSAAAKKRIVVDNDDEEEGGFWKDLEAARTLHPTQKNQQLPKSQRSIDDLDDAEMWATLEEVTNQSSAASHKPVLGNHRAVSDKVDEMNIDDDDMWDIIRENERPALIRKPPAKYSPATATDPALNPIKQLPAREGPVADSEMDWDDVYAN